MSVKFQDQAAARAVEDKTEELAHRVGERLTGGKTQTGYLQVFLLRPVDVSQDKT